MILDLSIFPKIDLEQNCKNKRDEIENPPIRKKDIEIFDDFKFKFPKKQCYSKTKKK